jgi:ribosomal protein S18 acetylase RimI-like enzyme
MDFIFQKGTPLTEAHRESLYPLFERVFGIGADLLQDYYERGFWNPDYCPYTLFHKGKAVANVSVFPMKWMIDGKEWAAAGIQSVMTDPEFRKKGFMKKLMNKVMKDLDAKYPLVFLQTENPDLYRSYGFSEVEEQVFITTNYQKTHSTEGTLKKLDLFKDEDLPVIERCFQEMDALSLVFAPLDYKHSFYLNLYNPFFQDKLFFCESLNALILYGVQNSVLQLYDVIGKKMPTLAEISGVIPEPFTSVEVYFSPDKLGELNFQAKKANGTLMVKGNLSLPSKAAAFPATASF